jgi:multidrug efflux pump subunit AcrB
LIGDIIGTLLVRNSEGTNIPVSALVTLGRETGYSTITAGREGEYIPIIFNNPGKQARFGLPTGVEQIVRQDAALDVSFSGSWFETRLLMREMMLVVLISLLLFILYWQPSSNRCCSPLS